MYCQIRQIWLAIWPIPVGDLVNTGWCFGQYRLAIWPKPVGDLANTSENRDNIISIPAKIWAGLRSKSGILKTWGVLELLDMGSRLEKIDLATEVSL